MITSNEWTYLRPYINDKRVIEIGCGTCAFANEAADKVHEIVAVDIDDKSKFVANLPNLYFMRMDATKLEFRPYEFDCAVFYNTVGHLESVLEECIDEALRVLKEDGYILIGSSFAYDVATLRDTVLPMLERKGYCPTIKQIGMIKWVVVSKKTGWR